MDSLDAFWIGVGYGGWFVMAVLCVSFLCMIDLSECTPVGQANPQGQESEQDKT